MKKIFVPMLLIIMLAVSGCAKGSVNTTAAKGDSQKTITYQSENGPIKIPANPKRIVVLYGTLSGHVMALGGNIVGVEKWSMANERYKKYLTNAVEVSEDNIEKIIQLKPDLIIAGSTTKNLDKLKKIAPTVSFTYGKLDYLNQYIEVGKLLNKEKQAQEWVSNFKQKAAKAGKEIKEKIGSNATVSVIEGDSKQLYVFGNNWGRGTEILYKAMGLKMPKKVEQKALKPGYYDISPEVLSEYAGDYMVFAKDSKADNSFQKTETYKSIPAVKNNHVLEVNASEFYFNDPISLDYQLNTFIKYFLGNK